jgi:hypothetical protein
MILKILKTSFLTNLFDFVRIISCLVQVKTLFILTELLLMCNFRMNSEPFLTIL